MARLKIWDSGSNVWRYVDSAVNTLTSSYSYTSSYSDTASYSNRFVIGEYIQFIPATSSISHSEGRIFYDSATHTLCVYNDKSNVTLNVGEEQWVRIVNKTGAIITNGAAVTVSGSQGNRPKGILAQSTISTDHHHTYGIIGIATEDIADNDEGMITTLGVVRGINTSNFNSGDILYVSSSAGELTNVKPVFPYDEIKVGIALNSTNNGSIFVSPVDALHVDDISGTGTLRATASLATTASFSVTASYSLNGGTSTGGGTKTIARFSPIDYQPPSSSYAQLTVRNNRWFLAYDGVSPESGSWISTVPEATITSSGLGVSVHFISTDSSSLATTRSVVFGAAIDRLYSTNILTRSFDTAYSSSAQLPAITGSVGYCNFTCSRIDNVQPNEDYELMLFRNTADTADTSTADVNVLSVIVTSV